MTRLLAAALAVLLLAVHHVTSRDGALIVVTVAWTVVSLGALRLPRVQRSAIAWLVDAAVALALIWASGDWRSPYYLYAITTLVLPATSLRFRSAVLWGLGYVAAYLAVAVATERLDGGTLRSTRTPRDDRDPPHGPARGRPRARLRPAGARPSGGRARAQRAPRRRGRAPAHRLGAARLRQAARARGAPRPERAGRRAAGRAARDRRPGARRAAWCDGRDGHERGRAARAAGGSPGRRPAARAGRRARRRLDRGDLGHAAACRTSRPWPPRTSTGSPPRR